LGVRTGSTSRTLGGLAVYACARGRAVGVDIERVQEHADLLDVADVCFSRFERTTLTALPPLARTDAFFRRRTRKEAYVKAVGSGLLAPLHEFDVAFGPHEPPALLRVRQCSGEAQRWSMAAVDLPAGYVGALVTERVPGPSP
jgi:4'-phosphopantetheinyl transferase